MPAPLGKTGKIALYTGIFGIVGIIVGGALVDAGKGNTGGGLHCIKYLAIHCEYWFYDSGISGHNGSQRLTEICLSYLRFPINIS